MRPSCPTSRRTRFGTSTTRRAPNVAEGIEHLQMLGVKYFMAETPDIEAAADADSSLQLVATVGPFPVTYTSTNGSYLHRPAADVEDLRGRRLGRGEPRSSTSRWY